MDPTAPPLPYRRTLTWVPLIVAVSALEGAVQLVAGVATPPDTGLPPGLTTWVLPGVWLALSVAVPSGAAAALAARRSPHAPAAGLVASAALGLELLVQLPFLGFSVLQLVLGVVAVTMAAAAVAAGRSGAWAGTGQRRASAALSQRR